MSPSRRRRASSCNWDFSTQWISRRSKELWIITLWRDGFRPHLHLHFSSFLSFLLSSPSLGSGTPLRVLQLWPPAPPWRSNLAPLPCSGKRSFFPWYKKGYHVRHVCVACMTTSMSSTADSLLSPCMDGIWRNRNGCSCLGLGYNMAAQNYYYVMFLSTWFHTIPLRCIKLS